MPRAQRERVFEELGIRRNVRLTRATMMEAAVVAEAAVVVYGSFEVAAGEGGAPAGPVALTVETLDVRRLRRGVKAEEAGPLEELSALETKLAWRLLMQMRPNTAMSEERFREEHPPVRLDALESYTRGLLAGSLDQKLALFANAARLEPAYSQPCFQLGKIHFERRDYRAAAEWLGRVKAADSNHREGVFLLGVTRYHLGDFAGAREAFARVAEEVPLAFVLNNLGVAQFRAGDAEAGQTLTRAVEGDEADPDIRFNLAYVQWRRGEYEAAAQGFKAVLERTPEDESAALLLARAQKGAGPKTGEPRLENLERIKRQYDDTAWLHLRAILGADREPK